MTAAAAARHDVPVRGTPQARPALRLVPTGADVDEAANGGHRGRPRGARAHGAPVDGGAAGLRLTRGGRLALALTVAVVAVVLVSGLARAAAGGPAATRSVTVQPGQTLSHIAARELPHLPTGTAVAEIQLANRLNTSHVHAGQLLVIPEVG